MTALRQHLTIVTAAAILVITPGCVREDMSSCPAEIEILCTFTRNEYATDRFRDEVKHLDLFVYDEAGSLVETSHVPVSEMKKKKKGMVAKQSLNLQQGTYTVVGWANVEQGCHSFTSTEKLPDAQVGTEYTAKDGLNVVEKTLPALFWAQASLEVPLRRIASCHLDMKKNAHDIHIQIEGPGNYDMTVSASNGFYHFDDTPSDDGSPVVISYFPEFPDQPLSSLPEGHAQGVTKADPVGCHNTIRTQSLYFGDDSRLTISDGDTGSVLIDTSLTELLGKDPSIATDEDIARRGHYDLKFKVEDEIILVQVNDWEMADQSTGV